MNIGTLTQESRSLCFIFRIFCGFQLAGQRLNLPSAEQQIGAFRAAVYPADERVGRCFFNLLTHPNLL